MARADGKLSPRLRAGLVALGAAAVALTVVGTIPETDLALRSMTGQVAIETAAALIALLVAFIVLGAFFRTGERSDLVLAGAFVVLAFSNLFFSAIPTIAGAEGERFTTWSSLAGRVVGAAGIAAAAFTRGQLTRGRRRAVAQTVFAATTVVAVIAFVAAALEARLPVGIDPALSPDAADHPRFVGHPALLANQVIITLCWAAATVGFALRARRSSDELVGWFAIASLLGAFASFNYVLFPSRYSEWIFTGDLLRLASYLALLLGAALQIATYQQRLSEAAALEERRRLARELHDGLAQELAFISTQTRFLAKRAPDTKGLDQLAVAAERALDESRSAISALTRPLDEPLDAALAQAAEDVAGRVGVRLRLDLEEGIAVEPRTREALIRIVREAVSNTARHGRASHVTLELANDAGLRLKIGDDGVGFDPDAPRERGFGLTSMKERAQALGGDMRIVSEPGAGTEIEVVLP